MSNKLLLVTALLILVACDPSRAPTSPSCPADSVHPGGFGTAHVAGGGRE